MKKTYLGLLFLVCGALNANDCFLEGKVGYFLPTDSRFKKTFSGGPIYGLEFDYQVWKPIYAWLGVDYFTKSGRTQGSGDRTRIQMVRINLGLEYIYNEYWVQPYIGGGPQATYFNSHVDSHFLIRNQSNWGIGALAKTGVMFKVSEAFLIDLFANYSWQAIEMHRTHRKRVIIHNADLSGFSFGVGLGYRF